MARDERAREAKRERRDPGYTDDIVNAAAKIKNYLHGKHRGQFDSNEMLRDAVIRQLGIVGEAAASLSTAFREAHPKVPWKDIIGLRQVVLHKYWNVDMDIIWPTAKNDVQTIATYLRKVRKRRLDAESAGGSHA
jgi:uncharacterized protein with HEPN domain